jgi:hypothetical protein
VDRIHLAFLKKRQMELQNENFRLIGTLSQFSYFHLEFCNWFGNEILSISQKAGLLEWT